MNDENILEKLLTPENNDAAIERRKEEKRRRVKGSTEAYQFRLIPLNSG
jgi:hypothetical protein